MAIFNLSIAAFSNTTLAKGLLAFTLISWAFWLIGSYILDQIRVKSLIRNLPTLGRGHWFSGNLTELYHIGNIGFHTEAKKRYGGALVIHGILGVRISLLIPTNVQAYLEAGRANIFFRPTRNASHPDKGAQQLREAQLHECVSCLILGTELSDSSYSPAQIRSFSARASSRRKVGWFCRDVLSRCADSASYLI